MEKERKGLTLQIKNGYHLLSELVTQKLAKKLISFDDQNEKIKT
jgi:hypothetical protein